MKWRLAVLSMSAMLALIGCGDDKPPPTKASAEPAKTAEAPPPPASASAQASAAPAESASAAPAESAAAEAPSGSAAPEGSGSAEAHGGKKKGGKKKGDGDDDGDGKKDKSDKVIKLKHAKMEFNHPGNGWMEVKKGAWTLFRPNDKSATLAFVEFDKPGESTQRIGQIADNLDLSDVKWKGDQKKVKVGPDKLDGMHAEGTCKQNKKDCEVEYYTVAGEVLIVFAQDIDAKKANKWEKMADKSVDTLRKDDGKDDDDKKGGGGKKGGGKKKK